MSARSITYNALLLLLFSLRADAQEKDFVIGKVETIHSSVLGEDRTINIYLPQGYDTGKGGECPVIYLLDGSANEDFIHICGLVQFFNLQMGMPDVIVVGIANIDRKRDFTFPSELPELKEKYPTTGHSAPFIDFLQKELKPFIEKKYSNNPQSILIGQSLGGLLASEIILKRPGLFSRYIIISPSLWWDDESLLKEAPQLVKGHTDAETKVSILVGKEGKVMEDDALQLAMILKRSSNKKLKVDFIPMPREDHGTILHNAVYEVLKRDYFKDGR